MEQLERRRSLAEHLLAGRSMAGALEAINQDRKKRHHGPVHLATIYRDFKAWVQADLEDQKRMAGTRRKRQRARLEDDLRRYKERRNRLLEAHKIDDRAVARYGDLIVKVEDRLAKLLGLDAPTKLEAKVEGTIETTGKLEVEIIRQAEWRGGTDLAIGTARGNGKRM